MTLLSKSVFSNAAAEIWFSTICTHFQVKEKAFKGFNSHRHGNAAQPVLTANLS